MTVTDLAELVSRLLRWDLDRLVEVLEPVEPLSQLTQTFGEKIHLTSCELLSQLATGAAA